MIGLLLRPVEPALGAIDTQAQIVLVAGHHLARPEHTLRPALEAQHDMGVVIELAAFDEAGQIGAELAQLQTGNEARKIVGMGADIADTTAGTGALRIGAPIRLFLARSLQPFGQPVLGIFHLYDAEIAKRALGHHLPCVPDHRIAGVVIGNSEDAATFRRQFREAFRFLQGRGQRLIADHMNASLEKGAGDWCMHMIGRDDRHRLDAVGPLGLGLGHRREIAVDAVLAEAQSLAGLLRLLRCRGKRTGEEIIMIVHAGSEPVHGADEGPLAATHHAEPYAAGFAGGVFSSFNCHLCAPYLMPSMRLLAA